MSLVAYLQSHTLDHDTETLLREVLDITHAPEVVAWSRLDHVRRDIDTLSRVYGVDVQRFRKLVEDAKSKGVRGLHFE